MMAMVGKQTFNLSEMKNEMMAMRNNRLAETKGGKKGL
jgi:hypothetical protein